MAFRQSKYKYVKGTVLRPEAQYPQLNINQSSGDYNLLAASCEWIAASWQSTPSGSIGILGLDETGRRKNSSVPLLNGHNGQITDLAWNPFHEWVLASSSSDGTVKLWKLPEHGLTGNCNTPEITFDLQGNRPETLAWNPSGFNLLASGSVGGLVNIFDVQQQNPVITVNDISENVDSISWNYNGSHLAAVSRDRKLRILDPRSSNAVLYEGDAHEAVSKPMRVSYLGKLNQLITTGFSKMRDLQFALWDERNLKKPLTQQNIGASPGISFPVFDQDTNLLFLTSRGDSTIKTYEVTNEATFIYELSPVVDRTPHRGICRIPKRACDLMSCEVVRILKATNNSIVPVGYRVPRKTYMEFHHDLFPDTPGPEPALSTQEWLDGQNKDPVLVSLAPEPELPADNDVGQTNDNVSQTSVTDQPAQKKTGVFNIFDKQEKKEEEYEYYTPNVVKIVRSSKFKYITGAAAKRVDSYENMDILNDAMQTKAIDGNQKWFGVIWKGIGGRLAIYDTAKDKGRSPSSFSMIEAGSSIVDFSFSPYHENIIATGADSSQIKIWKIPDGGVRSLPSNLLDSEMLLSEHSNKIVTLDFHPLASNLLVSTAGDLTIKLWDINQSKSKITLSGLEDIVTSTTWNYDGSILGTSSKDGKIRFWDPRSGSSVAERGDIGGNLGTKITWLGNQDKIAMVGYDKHVERNVSVVDFRKTDEVFANLKMGSGSGTLNPHYDSGTGVLALWSKGEGSIRFIEINDSAPYVHHLTDYSTNDPQVGIAFLPKSSLDVKNVELFNIFKLSLDKVIPVSFTIPRQRKEFFQDDVYTDVISSEPTLEASEWFAGETRQPKLMSLQPPGMKKLSDAPKQETLVKRVVIDDSNDFSIDKFTDHLMDRFKETVESYRDDTPLPGEDKEGVDSDEWDDY